MMKIDYLHSSFDTRLVGKTGSIFTRGHLFVFLKVRNKKLRGPGMEPPE
ncbi:MAG: hypothetical protein KFF73_12505 [Cyclobacteriaceae bacterium]|nr:hypothetical protein [Cyclobacteriaceae bacterium]